MHPYADSSFLVSCYVTDGNTTAAKGWLGSAGTGIVYTALHALEVRNVFKLGVFRGYFAAVEAAGALQNLERDLKTDRLVPKRVDWATAFRISGLLSGEYSARLGTRSLDVLHVGVAKSLGVRQFVSFDVRQRALAAAVGFDVGP